MTRHDVANLVIRTFALWLGVTGVSTLASAAWLAQVPGQPAPLFTALLLAIPLPAAAVVWLAAPTLARAAFDRPDDPVMFGITRGDVPPLACFVVGLVVLAGAVPQAVSWVGIQALRSQVGDSLMEDRMMPPLDQQSAGTAGEIVGRLIVGAVLVTISRRRGIWSTTDGGDGADADSDRGEA
jgi:hypothetical protein